ncbi:NUDIX domain-containing protein [Tenacibaculum tangerinum]|uniref:NUDIX domain-containing protein n=1 Tax=Tenacibaculum tangerinum TaxID=3038772 RepID=A0ABY8L631_9FLAO|nr:NUDIX domain-containing protein [Tenacibaculum tangerinum]WGH76744.1 NUDIX domain-containing protein [Tenacibaculum tangerinum]
MYKVFVNDKPIIFTTSLKNEEDFPVFICKNIIIEELIYRLKVGKLEGVYLYSNDFTKDWLNFKVHFKMITAAGGLVLNKNRELLFIYRADKWDLPKGRVEEGEDLEEAAIREVEEECGIEKLIIKRKLLITYHLFIQQNEYRLKETHWYLMFSNYERSLTPQLEEGITKAEFKNAQETKHALQNTFANIIMVYESYLNNVD